jgi:pimeloyl-ACP methyl ester carboxylesterase
MPQRTPVDQQKRRLEMDDCNPRNFGTLSALVRPGVEISFVREGVGGFPLLLLHGWPGSKRLFWRNIAPLAAVGFEVIVPDQRGFGETPDLGNAPLTVPESARDMYALMRHLGHDQCVVAAGDQGSLVMLDMSARFPELIVRQLIYNGGTPFLQDVYLAAGLPANLGEDIALRSDHMYIHGEQADLLAGKLDSDAKRLDYIEGMFLGTHSWRHGDDPIPLAGPGNFDAESARFQAEPLATASVFRTSLALYESLGELLSGCSSEPPFLDRIIDKETMILWGMADGIVSSVFPKQLELACPNRFGPYWLPGVGHFVQWEAAEILNRSLFLFCRDLLRR